MKYGTKMASMVDIARIEVTNENETDLLANDLSIILSVGNVCALTGDLGVGKTSFCRSVIRSLATNDTLEVPSPTFTLLQTYETERFDVVHLDLYRLQVQSELIELGYEDYLENSVLLIEWAENGKQLIPPDSLWLIIEQGSGDCGRIFNFKGDPSIWQDRLDRTRLIRNFLKRNGFDKVKRRHLEGDASTRQYETILCKGDPLILMNSPHQPERPILRNGKSYSQIAHIAETTHSFVAVDKLLESAGVKVPKIYAMDMQSGLLILEYLGNTPILYRELPDEEKYFVAVELLAKIHERDWSRKFDSGDGNAFQIPNFTMDAMQIEIELFLDWYVPIGMELTVSDEQRYEFITIWLDLLGKLKNSEKSIVLRDYHSPNILWQSGEEGTNRIGVLDFQDAVIGPSAYDLASLVQDARVDVSAELESKLVGHYRECRQKLGNRVSQRQLDQEIAILSAQRATKIIGIFTRLSSRDGKHAYLDHIPRVVGYLKRSLKHPVLIELESFLIESGWL